MSIGVRVEEAMSIGVRVEEGDRDAREGPPARARG